MVPAFSTSTFWYLGLIMVSVYLSTLADSTARLTRTCAVFVATIILLSCVDERIRPNVQNKSTACPTKKQLSDMLLLRRDEDGEEN